MSMQDKIREAFAPQPCGNDPPHAPQRVHRFQTASDRLRDKAADFVTIAVSLVPDPDFHDELIEFMSSTVLAAEDRLAALLEETPEFKRDGFKRREDGTFGYAAAEETTEGDISRSEGDVDGDDDDDDTGPIVADVRRR